MLRARLRSHIPASRARPRRGSRRWPRRAPARSAHARPARCPSVRSERLCASDRSFQRPRPAPRQWHRREASVGAKPARHRRSPPVAFALVKRGAVREHAVAGLVAARRDADDAFRTRAERRHDAGDAGRIPCAEIEIALELQLGVEIDDAPRLTRRCLGVRLRAAALQRGDASRCPPGSACATRSSTSFFRAPIHRVRAPQPARIRVTSSTDQRAHVHPPMNGSASMRGQQERIHDVDEERA